MWSSYLHICSVIHYVISINIDDKIDSPFSTDCFKRISIGERLVVYDVSRTAERNRVKDCEKDCFDFGCTFFSFGISAAGNGTCELSTRREAARRRDPDYDIYQRTKFCKQGKPTGYEQSCYRRLYVGKRLNDRFIRHSLPCESIQACQHQCSIEQHFQCHGFNIRLDESGLGRGVCELTSTRIAFLDPTRDFHREPDFDFYEKDTLNNSPNCGFTNEVVSILPKLYTTERPQLYSTTERWRPVSPSPWSYGTDPQQNEIPNHDGKDRRFRPYDWPHGRSMPTPSMRLPGYAIVDADSPSRPQQGHHTEQGRSQFGRNFGRDFKGYLPHPPIPPPVHSYPAQPPYQSTNSHERKVCYQREYPAMRLRPEMIRAAHTMTKISECESMCSSASFQCVGFTFRYRRLPDVSPNCYLTDSRSVDTFSDLTPDRDCDVFFRAPTCQSMNTLPDTDCFTRMASDAELRPEVLKLRVSAISLSECELECLRADGFICRSFSYGAGQGGDNCHLSDWPPGSLSQNQLMPNPGSALYERGSFGRGCELDMGRPNYPGNRDHRQQGDSWGRDAWRHFTVRGWPCRRGTQCALNKDAGFWSCEVEGGDYAQWDYCCRPQHACGHSQGYSYPWCYVGEAGPDQWRPCSENFYPNYGDQRPINRPSSHSEFGPPSQWPISYIYPEPPPNETVYFTPNADFGYLPLPPKADYPETPFIQFRPSQQITLPKAIVQKLDLKAGESPEVPKNTEESTVNINPRNSFAKKVKDSERKFVFNTEGEAPKNSSSNYVQGGTSVDFMSSYVNDTIVPKNVSKTKAILDQVEKLIEMEIKDCKKNATEVEKMDRDSSIGIGYFRGYLNETSFDFQKGPDAMTRFWNWGQENFFSKKKRKTR